jgi:ABC-type bacteriocin/lantibiotic exporter with double-glycine peptidase domain
MSEPVNKLEQTGPAAILKEVSKPKSTFRKDYRNANFLSKLTYFFATPLINAVNQNKGQITEEMIIDANVTDEATENNTKLFQDTLQTSLEAWLAKNPGKQKEDAPWQKLLKTALWRIMRADYLLCSFVSLIAECLSVCYTFMLMYIIRYLKDENAEVKEGMILAGGFSFLVLISGLFRNYYIFGGYHMAVKVRKVLVSAMYDKVGLLSMKSLTETNSGKLITLISSDIFNVERAMTMTPIALSAPFTTLFVLILIGIQSGWQYALMVTVIWILTLILSLVSVTVQKKHKIAEARLNDGRMKLVNDLISGIRTIKSYAWETHYLKKIS